MKTEADIEPSENSALKASRITRTMKKKMQFEKTLSTIQTLAKAMVIGSGKNTEI